MGPFVDTQTTVTMAEDEPTNPATAANTKQQDQTNEEQGATRLKTATVYETQREGTMLPPASNFSPGFKTRRFS